MTLKLNFAVGINLPNLFKIRPDLRKL